MRNSLPNRLNTFFISLPGVLFLFILTLIDFAVLRQLSTRLHVLAGGLTMLDTRLWYRPEELRAFLQALAPDNLMLFQRIHLLPDLLFPLLYSLTFYFTIRLLGKHLGLPIKTLKAFANFSLLAGILDLLENFSLLILTMQYPTLSAWLAQLAPILTLLKWVLLAALTLLVVGLLVLFLVKRKSVVKI